MVLTCNVGLGPTIEVVWTIISIDNRECIPMYLLDYEIPIKGNHPD